jgi:hypothetical protein
MTLKAKVKSERLREVKEEALRFLRVANLIDLEEEKWYGSRNTGAVKRASLDLTRALARFRQND